MVRFLIIFVALLLLTGIGVSLFGSDWGQGDYWDHHGIFLLAALTFFPRLALLISSIPFGGFFYWLGFFFCPHLLVAVLATINYAASNPVLVTFAWLVALGGESTEKYYIQRKVVRPKGRVIDVEAVEVNRRELS